MSKVANTINFFFFQRKAATINLNEWNNKNFHVLTYVP